jgi:hypothetical protein
MLTSKKNAVITALLALSLGQSLFAATIYDNSVNDLVTRFNPGTIAIGDEINLAGTERYLSQFDFEYWGTSAGANFAGNVQARVGFYLNDGALFNGYATPGTQLFDSGWFGIGTTPRSTLVFTAGSDFSSAGLFIPSSTITWTVQFQGMSGSDAVGVDLYSPPVVGSSVPDYWQNSGGGWQLMTNTVAMNFGARLFASADPVPEPSMLTFWVSSALLLVGAGRMRRTRK